MAKKKQTPNQAEYAKQERRIKRSIQRLRRRGYTVNFEMPIKPKRITKKKLRELAAIKPSDIYAQSQYIDPTTGEILPGNIGRLREKEVSKLATQRGSIILNNLQDLIKTFRVTPSKNVIEELIERGIKRKGETSVVRALSLAEARGMTIDWYSQYRADIMSAYVWEVGKDIGLTDSEIMQFQETIDDIINYTMDWSYIN